MLIDFQTWKDRILKMLTVQSNPMLAYHGVDHTIDVLCNAERIALEEGITDKKDLLLLKLAALYHDTGFLHVYKGHEEKSCELVRKELSDTPFSEKDIERICSMIMATRIPQSPKNHLEEILCDADLDYLGRNDFDLISYNLRTEYFGLGMVKTEAEWMQIQINFIGKHRYFTNSTRRKREDLKTKHLRRLRIQADLEITNSKL